MKPSKTPQTRLSLSLDSHLKQAALRTAAKRGGTVSDLISEALQHYLDSRRTSLAEQTDLQNQDAPVPNKNETAMP